MNAEKFMSPISFGIIALILSALSAYYFLYNTEVYENRRFLDSFNQSIVEAQDEPKKLAALKALQKKGLEWAHYQFVDSIQTQDLEVVDLYVAAGMVLKNKGSLIEQLVENPDNWVSLVERLGWGNKESLSGLFPVPRHLSAFDIDFEKIEQSYAIPHDIAFKDHYLEFRKIHDKWLNEKSLELANVDTMCDGNTRCKIKNVPGIHVEYEKKKPFTPTKDLIVWQKPQLSLMSAAILLKNEAAVNYLQQKEVVSRVSKMTMSDRMVVVFEVSPEGVISYPEGITVKTLKLVKRQIGPPTE